MKKLKIILAIITAMTLIFMTGCFGRKCFKCGERATRGYEMFGNFYCEKCF